MDFIIKRFNGLFSFVIYAVIIVAVMYFFINILPYVLVIGLITWMVFKIIRILKSIMGKKESVITSMNDGQDPGNITSTEFTNGQIIDVDYKEL